VFFDDDGSGKSGLRRIELANPTNANDTKWFKMEEGLGSVDLSKGGPKKHMLETWVAQLASWSSRSKL
jgi:hypothetical protein